MKAGTKVRLNTESIERWPSYAGRVGEVTSSGYGTDKSVMVRWLSGDTQEWWINRLELAEPIVPDDLDSMPL